jgi:pimeloyl-ACP methyl ester carboxylesterase
LGVSDSIRKRAQRAVTAATDIGDYTRQLVRGNRFRSRMSWSREGAPPVVLVHGFLGTRGTMVPLTRRLQGDGRVVFSHAHGTFNMASIRSSAEGLLTQIRSICEELGVEKVDVVGFSMGGLIGLHAIKFLQGHRWVRRLCTLGTPFKGTWVGLAGVVTMGVLSPSVWQVLPGSSFLEELLSAPMPESVEVRQIHGASDAFVPNRGPIPGVTARNYILLPGGHSSLVVAPHFYDAVHEFLEEGVEETRDAEKVVPQSERDVGNDASRDGSRERHGDSSKPVPDARSDSGSRAWTPKLVDGDVDDRVAS